MIFKKIKAKEDDVFKNKLDFVLKTKEILKKYPLLVIYPIIGAILSIISFVLLIMVSKGNAVVLIALSFWYILTSIIVIYFNTATVAFVKNHLNGGNPTFSYGIGEANKRIYLIINWAFFSSIFSFFMIFLSSIKIIKYFTYAGEIAWSLVTYFVIPIIVFENKNIKDTIIESQKLIKKNWGKSLKGDFKISFISFVPFVIILSLLIFSSVLKDELITYGLFIFTIFILIVSMLINYAMRNIFCTLLYSSVKSKTK